MRRARTEQPTVKHVTLKDGRQGQYSVLRGKILFFENGSGPAETITDADVAVVNRVEGGGIAPVRRAGWR